MDTTLYDKKKAVITTLITTYLRPKLLKRAINSVLLQTYQNFQIVVCDNGSDDETRNMMEIFIQADARIKYYRHASNIGMMANYEFAFNLVNTPFFSILSDDDFLLQSFYETALKGFENYPDAAFSACEVVAMNESGEPVSAPLSLWSREGYYPAGEGLMEMIGKGFKPPVPTGILFQHSLVKNISINFSNETQLVWDLDYLVSITANFPCVITKKEGAIFLAHHQGYSTSLHEEMFWKIDRYDDYMLSLSRVLQNIKKTSSLNLKDVRTVRRLFRTHLARQTEHRILNISQKKKYKIAHFLAKSFYRNFNYHWVVLRAHFNLLLLVFFLKSKNITRAALELLGIKKAPASQFHFSNELKSHYEYGQYLFKDLAPSKNDV